MSEKIMNEMNLILEEKLKLLNNIFKYTKRQEEVVTNDNVVDIETFIKLKQIEINKIDKLDIQFYNLFNELKQKENILKLENLEVKKYPQAKKLKSLTTEIFNLLKQIQVLEQKNSVALKSTLENVKSELRNINAGKKMVSGYNTYKNVYNNSSVIIDQKK
ncbi:flagellar export chaperone FlgN [Abyssisolibacter fermentans]|uniref:flagellar export chaperone FlgN n=1 Tax=Abyssisolibacter fermentans TaxID=1766203 RepID=UPI00082F8BB8|nr:flagellar export chaperone FlgN [Abyssisolibacter fermentans]